MPTKLIQFTNGLQCESFVMEKENWQNLESGINKYLSNCGVEMSVPRKVNAEFKRRWV